MKRFLALAWRRSADEKIPLSSKNSATDNGAITKLPPPPSKQPTEKADQDKMADGKVADLDGPGTDCKPMSLLRKFAMLLSFNLIALYFAAFAWLIPCRILNCSFGQEWKVHLDNISVSTNVEISGLPSSELLLFGYIDRSEDAQGVAALLSSTGSMKWKISLNYSPVHCYCNVIDVDGDGVLDCLILGEAHLLALNVSNGYVFWIQKFRKISSLVVTVSGCDDSQWIVLVEDQGFRKGQVNDQQPKHRISLVILDSINAKVVKHLPLPCDSFPRQLVTWKSKTNVTQIAFLCSYNTRTEVRLIAEDELCNLVFGRSEPKRRGFSVLFSFGSSTAVEDVSLLPLSHVGLTVGWSTMVAMATDAQNTPRLLWKTTSGSIRSAIKFVLGGHFTSRNSTQIAVLVNDDSSNSVKVVNVLSGQEVSSIEIGAGAVSSVQAVPGSMESNDHLLIIKEAEVSTSPNDSASQVIDSTTENAFFASTPGVSRQLKAYLLLTFAKESKVTELLTENRRTAVAVRSGDCTTVFLATWISNETTRISSRNLKDPSSKSSCSCR